jgi:serine/threonine protein phosphatase PrpC
MAETDTIKNIALEIVSLTDKGPHRQNNEDCVAVVYPEASDRVEKGILLIVADGLGGQNAGEIASKTATEELAQAYYLGENPCVEENLSHALEFANRCVHSAGNHEDSRSGMATTIVASVICGNDLITANVGDSRAYLFRNGVLTQVTEDHSISSRALFWGDSRPPEGERSTVLYRAIGAEEDVRPAMSRQRLMPADIILLCSDGLTDALTDIEIAAVLEGSTSLDQAAQQLVQDANRRDSGDNVSLVLARASGSRDGNATCPEGDSGGCFHPSPQENR